VRSAPLNLWLQLARDRYETVPEVAHSTREVSQLRGDIVRELDGRRQKFRSRPGRLWAMQAIDRMMSGLVGEGILNGTEYGSAFEAIETLKARLLLDQMTQMPRPAAPALVAELLERERAVLRFKSSTTEDTALEEMRLLSLLSVGLSWNDADRIQGVDDLEAVYETNGIGFAEVARVATLKQVHDALDPDEALVEYFIPSHLTHPAQAGIAFCISSEAIRIIRLPLDALGPGVGFIGKMSVDGMQPLDASPLTEAIWGMRAAIRGGREEEADHYLQMLWQVLIFPLLNDWHYPDEHKRWIIIPHGPLHYVPFGALRELGEDGVRVIEDVAITVCPSTSVWLRLRQRERKATRAFLGIADPLIRTTNLPKLKDSLKEVSNAIKRLKGYEAVPLLADQATETRVRAEIPGKSIVHFAAHGEFPEDDPFDFHRILLTPDATHDGALRSEEFRTMDLSTARLVVLSICDGGLFRFGPGDEPLGLIPSLFVAGAENVLAPLWLVEDAAARRHTGEFYKHVLKHGPAEALRRACKKALKNGTELRDWAGFVNAGPGRVFDVPVGRKKQRSGDTSA
jgi:hypothetical protein